MRLGKGLLRTLLLAFEAKIKGRIPSTHALFAWLVAHAGDVLSKHLIGKDGHTPYERLYGKKVSEEGLEFGEVVHWRRHSPEQLQAMRAGLAELDRLGVGAIED